MYVNSLTQSVATKEKTVDTSTQIYTMLEQQYVNSTTFTMEVVDFTARATSRYKQPNYIREALEKGYVEMSHINLSICKECMQAEFEAEHMVERLVSGR